jgi:phosphoribosylformylglycinamidine cyclo-ligase
MSITYRDAGVDIGAGDALVDRIKPLARQTRTDTVVDGIGGFAGLCALPADIPDPLLVSGTDGVGTKLKVAFATGRHDTVGQDLVAMCVNDIITTGARPLFFLDYFACGRLDVDVAESVIRGIADGCSLAGCALVGGETAELPSMYAEGEYDLAGFAVGVVSRQHVLGPQAVREDDELVAVASSGLHSNGYSLARRVLESEMKLGFEQTLPELERTVGEELLVPTRIYARAVAQLGGELGMDLHALCHVTGGGVVGNLPRVLPPGTRAELRFDHERPPIFDVISRGGPVSEVEMQRTFNLGIGMVAVVAQGRGTAAVAALEAAGERAWTAGRIAKSPSNETPRVELL